MKVRNQGAAVAGGKQEKPYSHWKRMPTALVTLTTITKMMFLQQTNNNMNFLMTLPMFIPAAAAPGSAANMMSTIVEVEEHLRLVTGSSEDKVRHSGYGSGWEMTVQMPSAAPLTIAFKVRLKQRMESQRQRKKRRRGYLQQRCKSWHAADC